MSLFNPIRTKGVGGAVLSQPTADILAKIEMKSENFDIFKHTGFNHFTSLIFESFFFNYYVWEMFSRYSKIKLWKEYSISPVMPFEAKIHEPVWFNKYKYWTWQAG